MASDENLRGELERYLSRHRNLRRSGDAYEFNVKVYQIDIPDRVRESMDAEQIETIYQEEAQNRLGFLDNDLSGLFDWIAVTNVEGRSGGWLVIYAKDEILEPDTGEVVNVRDARRRLKDLKRIDRIVKETVSEFKSDMSKLEWWRGEYPGEIGRRQDWTPKDD